MPSPLRKKLDPFGAVRRKDGPLSREECGVHTENHVEMPKTNIRVADER